MTDQFLQQIDVPCTQRNYRIGLAKFKEWFEAEKGELDWRMLDRLVIREYVRSMSGKFERGTIKGRIIAIKAFYKWAKRMGMVDHNPAKDIIIPKQPSKLPRFLTTDQAIALLDAPLQMGRTLERIRDAAMFETLYSSGLRISELCAMNRSDIRMDEGEATIKGKGMIERLAPLTSTSVERIREYWDELEDPPTGSEPAFHTAAGDRIYPRLVQRQMKVYLAHAKLDPKLSPHKIRHSFATHMLDAGCDLRSVQELMGHSKITSTEIYTHVTIGRLQKAYQVHPRS